MSTLIHSQSSTNTFKRPTNPPLPAPIRSSAHTALNGNARERGMGGRNGNGVGGGGLQPYVDGQAGQNDGKNNAGPADVFNVNANAKRSRAAGVGVAGAGGIASPFSNMSTSKHLAVDGNDDPTSYQPQGRPQVLRNTSNTHTHSPITTRSNTYPTTATATSTSTSISTSKPPPKVPDQFPPTDVFYQPTPSSSKAHVDNLAGTVARAQAGGRSGTATVTGAGAGGGGGGGGLFKQPLPPSQLKRAGMPVVPHQDPSIPTRPNSNPNLNRENNHNHSIDQPAAKRRRIETGSLPLPLPLPTHEGQTTGPLIPTHPPNHSHGQPSATTTNIATRQTTSVQAQRQAAEEWRQKWTRAFPNFVFCFDVSLGAGAGGGGGGGKLNSCKAGIRKLGGRLEAFLSKDVTHYISNTATGPPVTAGGTGDIAPARRGVVADGGVARGASQLNYKVWSVSKLANVLDNLLSTPRPAPPPTRGQDELSALLEDERLHGTRERDNTAPRADWVYFPKGSYYLLVDDATGENRSIMVKDFPRPKPGEIAPWPIMHETFMKLSETARQNTLTAKQLKEKAWKTYVTREVDESKTQWAVTRGLALYDDTTRSMGPLTRSASMNQLDRRAALMQKAAEYGRDESMAPYHAASGNSVVLTSNIASTSARSTAGNTPGGAGMPGFGQGKDRRIIEMSKRVQLLKGQAAAKMSAAMTGEEYRSAMSVGQDPFVTDEYASGTGDHGIADDESSWTVGDVSMNIQDASSSSTEKSGDHLHGDIEMTLEPGCDAESMDTASRESDDHAPVTPRKTMEEQARDRVLAILEEARMPARFTSAQKKELKRARSMGFRLEAAPKKMVQKPGYCENCRVKYPDFDAHIVGKRHRRFAETPENFAELDEFLRKVRRVPKKYLEDLGQ